MSLSCSPESEGLEYQASGRDDGELQLTLRKKGQLCQKLASGTFKMSPCSPGVPGRDPAPDLALVHTSSQPKHFHLAQPNCFQFPASVSFSPASEPLHLLISLLQHHSLFFTLPTTLSFRQLHELFLNAHSSAGLAGPLIPAGPSVSLPPGTSALHCRDVFAGLFLPQPEAGTVSLSSSFPVCGTGPVRHLRCVC